MRARGLFTFAKVHYFRGCARMGEERELISSVEAISTGCADSFWRWGQCGKPSAMSRRSAADLSIVPMVPGKGRPEPPKALDQVEARAWNDVIDALPGQWIDLAGQVVLRRVSAQVAIAERVEARLRDLALRGDDPEALEAEQVLAAMHRETTKSVINGLSALRATPRSRMAAREGRNKFQRGVTSRPWEIVAKRDHGSAS